MQSAVQKIPDTILEDERVILRPLTETDYENLLPFALNEKGLWFYSLVRPEGEDGLKNYINIALNEKVAGKEFPFIVFDKKTNEYAEWLKALCIKSLHL